MAISHANTLTFGAITKLRASDGAKVGTFIVGSTPNGVAFDGVNTWVSTTGGTVSNR